MKRSKVGGTLGRGRMIAIVAATVAAAACSSGGGAKETEEGSAAIDVAGSNASIASIKKVDPATANAKVTDLCSVVDAMARTSTPGYNPTSHAYDVLKPHCERFVESLTVPGAAPVYEIELTDYIPGLKGQVIGPIPKSSVYVQNSIVLPTSWLMDAAQAIPLFAWAAIATVGLQNQSYVDTEAYPTQFATEKEDWKSSAPPTRALAQAAQDVAVWRANMGIEELQEDPTYVGTLGWTPFEHLGALEAGTRAVTLNCSSDADNMKRLSLSNPPLSWWVQAQIDVSAPAATWLYVLAQLWEQHGLNSWDVPSEECSQALSGLRSSMCTYHHEIDKAAYDPMRAYLAQYSGLRGTYSYPTWGELLAKVVESDSWKGMVAPALRGNPLAEAMLKPELLKLLGIYCRD